MFLKRLRMTLDMIKFEHSVFALPFALTGALLAFRESGFRASNAWWTARLDRCRHGGRPLCRHGVQSPGRCGDRRPQSANEDAPHPGGAALASLLLGLYAGLERRIDVRRMGAQPALLSSRPVGPCCRFRATRSPSASPTSRIWCSASRSASRLPPPGSPSAARSTRAFCC